MTTAVATINLRPEPVLWFGGAVSNRQAVEGLRAAAARAGIPADQVIGTGDAVAYAGDPAGTLDALREWGVRQIQGNCEQSLIAAADDCGCGFAAGSGCDLLTGAWYAHCDQQVDAARRAWLQTWPEQAVVQWAGRRIQVVHGAPSQINRFVFASARAADLRAELDLVDTDAVVGGHSGLPWSRLVDGRLWHNPGSIGLPANDGSEQTWYAIWRLTDAGAVVVEHHPLHYDVAGAVADMQAAGLTQGYHETLRRGRWPSEDVLPPTERAQAGQPLSPSTLIWR